MSATLISPLFDEVKSSSIAFSSVFEDDVTIFFIDESTVTGSFMLPAPVSVTGLSTSSTAFSPSLISFSVPSDLKTLLDSEADSSVKVSAVNVQLPTSTRTVKTMLPLSSVDTSASFSRLPLEFVAVTLWKYEVISGSGRAVRPACACESEAGTAPAFASEILPFTMQSESFSAPLLSSFALKLCEHDAEKNAERKMKKMPRSCFLALSVENFFLIRSSSIRSPHNGFRPPS